MTWSQQAKLTANDGAVDDYFGSAVAVDGNTAVITAPFDDDNGSASGVAYVFIRSGGVWNLQTKLTANDGAAGDTFGVSVAVAGDTIAIGAPGTNTYRGAVYVFTRNGTSWSQLQKLTANDGVPNDNFGYSIAIDGETAVIGARSDDDNGDQAGSAYIYTYSTTSSTWSEQAKLLASDGTASDSFGWSVAIDGETAVIGARQDDQDGSYSGSAYIFTRTGIAWSQQQKITPSDSAAQKWFGASVAIAGDTALIGANGDSNYKGAVYAFTRTGATWSQLQKIIASDGTSSNMFGWSMAMDGETAVIGAYQNGFNGVYSGAAYLYTHDGTNWIQVTKLLADDGATTDAFGYAIAVSGNTAVIGTPRDDDNGTDSGSAYMMLLPLTPLAVNITGDGTVDLNPVGTIGSGTTNFINYYMKSDVVTMTATADTGWSFDSWGGVCSGTTSCVVTMDAAKSVTATFTIDMHDLAVSLTGTGSGSVDSTLPGISCGADCSQTYEYGTMVTLTAVSNPNSTFTGWSGTCSGAATCVVTMDAGQSVTAAFKQEYMIFLPTILSE